MSKTLELNQLLNIKQKIETSLDEIKVLDRLNKKIIAKIMEVTGLTKKEIVDVLPVSMKTIERLDPNTYVDNVLAEHLMSIAKVAKEGGELFPDTKIFSQWLKTPHAVLSGLEPVEILRTVIGCHIVVDLLGRIKYGVYS